MKNARIEARKEEELYTIFIDAAADGGWRIDIKCPNGLMVTSDNVYSDDELDENYDLILAHGFEEE